MFISAWLATLLATCDGTVQTPQPTASPHNPVLLVHGISDDARSMMRMTCYLRANGWEVHTLNLKPNLGQAGLKPLAQEIEGYARREFSGRNFDLVGFSMGGLVSRYYMQRLGGARQVDHFITLSAPHHGTVLAYLVPNRGCREMRPGSDFLRDLDHDADQLRRVKFTSFYAALDLVIVPTKSSVMPQAHNVKLPINSHPGMVLEKRSLRAVAEALRT